MYRRRYESRRSSKLKLHKIHLKQKINKIWQKTIFDMSDGILTPCNVPRSWHWFRQVTAPGNVACCSGIVTMNSPSGSTLQCETWLWDYMPLNSPKHPPYWNSSTISPNSTCHSAPVSKILSILVHPQQKKWRHVDFQDGGSPPSWILGVQ